MNIISRIKNYFEVTFAGEDEFYRRMIEEMEQKKTRYHAVGITNLGKILPLVRKDSSGEISPEEARELSRLTKESQVVVGDQFYQNIYISFLGQFHT